MPGISPRTIRSGLKHAPRVFLWPKSACYGGSVLGRLRSGRCLRNGCEILILDPPPFENLTSGRGLQSNRRRPMMAMQLIPIHTCSLNEQTTETVNARDLYTFLEIGRDFATWLKARIKQYGFEEETDFTVARHSGSINCHEAETTLIPQNGGIKKRGGDKRSCDYFITLDMAKELAMVERNEKGRQARRYFIECEKQLKDHNQFPTPTVPAPDESEKFQLLNNIANSMDFNKPVVVIPTQEVSDMIAAIRMYQAQIARLQTPDWVEGSIANVKRSTNRNFADI